MFIVLLRFAGDRARAQELMPSHNAWIQRGIEEGVFLVVGSLKPGAGGAILAEGTRLSEIQARVAEDPFVVENVVKAEILEIAPTRTDARLSFLMG